MDTAMLEGLTVGRSTEPLPKRLVAGRETVPNPFVDAVHDSYREAIDNSPETAAMEIWVPVDKARVTERALVRKNAKGTQVATVWEQHPNITTALYLLRQAAIKHDIGVRIVVDYEQVTAEKITISVDGTNTEFTNVTVNKFKLGSGEHKGKVRVRFLGQKKKEQKPSDTATPGNN